MSAHSNHSAASTKPSRHRAPRDEAAQRERLEAFHQQLTDQVLALTDGSAWKAWLRTAARLHHYPFDNIRAVQLQTPGAGQVARSRTWQSLGRQVRTGEQRIKTLATVTRRSTADGDETSSESGGREANARRGGTSGETPE